jgi:hypothetical protein
LSDDILAMQAYIPREFSRKGQSIANLPHWKATEYRLFLLYTGPIILNNYLPSAYMEHFNLLHFAIYILSSSIYHENLLSQAQACISNFILTMDELFGKTAVTHNVHVLEQLPKFTEIYGTLDEFSSFPFENHLHHLKHHIRPTQHIFQHALNVFLKLRQQLSVPLHTQLYFSSKSPDNCGITSSGQVIWVTDVWSIDSKSSTLVDGYVLNFDKDLYSAGPYQSSTLRIGLYKKTQRFLRRCRLIEKCIIVPSDQADHHLYIVLPLVASEASY